MAHASRRALRALLSMRFLSFNELDLILIQGTSAKKTSRQRGAAGTSFERWKASLAAPAARGRREFRHLGLIVRRRVFDRRRRASILEESDPAEAGLALALFLATGLLGATALVVATAALPLAIGLSVAVGLLGLTARPLLLGIGLPVFALAPTLVVALNEAALGLDHPEIVVRILPIRLGHDAITR